MAGGPFPVGLNPLCFTGHIVHQAGQCLLTAGLASHMALEEQLFHPRTGSSRRYAPKTRRPPV